MCSSSPPYEPFPFFFHPLKQVECKLAYMEAQVEEAQHALGKKHASMVAAQEVVESLEANCKALKERVEKVDATLEREVVRERGNSEEGRGVKVEWRAKTFFLLKKNESTLERKKMFSLNLQCIDLF